MIALKNLRYVRLGTANLGTAAEYAQRILGLELVRSEGKAMYLRADDRDVEAVPKVLEDLPSGKRATFRIVESD